MAGIFRFYDNFFYGLGRGRFNFATDTIKLALLDASYVPSAAYGTRDSLFTYARGDTVYSATYNCFFVVTTAGTTAVGAPPMNDAIGATTLDGTVVWTSVGLAQPSTHAVLADTTGEVTGTGYSAGGATVSLTHTLTGRRAQLGTPVVVWPGSTVTAKYAVLYKVGTVDSVTDPLIGYVLLQTDGTTISSTSGDFRVAFGTEIVYQLGGV